MKGSRVPAVKDSSEKTGVQTIWNPLIELDSGLLRSKIPIHRRMTENKVSPSFPRWA